MPESESSALPAAASTPAAESRVAVVTGAGSGIGRACSVELSRRGFRLCLTGRRADRLAATAEACRDVSPDGTAPEEVPADITRESDVARLFHEVQRRFGRIDVLFNNAGINTSPKLPDEISADDWNAVLQTNVTGSFLCARAAFSMMRQQSPAGGRIINNGSVSAQVPRPGSCPYTVSKHAVTGLTRSIALDGRPFGIACSQIDIGNAATDMASSMATGVPQANGTTAVEPTMNVQHVAEMVAWIAELPLSANVLFTNVMATGMPFVGRG